MNLISIKFGIPILSLRMKNQDSDLKRSLKKIFDDIASHTFYQEPFLCGWLTAEEWKNLKAKYSV